VYLWAEPFWMRFWGVLRALLLLLLLLLPARF
jgi:hypothetical protein